MLCVGEADQAVVEDDRRGFGDVVGHFLLEFVDEFLVVREALQGSVLHHKVAEQAARAGFDHVEEAAHHADDDQHHRRAEPDSRDRKERDASFAQVAKAEKQFIHQAKTIQEF